MTNFRCPLCMNELPPGTKMLRFCGIHPQRPESISFELTPENLNDIFCPSSGNCNSSGVVARSPVLVHLGCVMLNPFISSEGELLPDLEYIDSAGIKVKVDGWEYEVTKQLHKHFSGVKAMFFPQAMFRALNESLAGQKVATSMLLLGEQGVGKSVLATMAIRRGVWNKGQTESGERLRGQSFVYVSPAMGGAGEQHTLAADNMRAAGDGPSLNLGSTRAMLRNIRALFLRALAPGESSEMSEPEIDAAWVWNWMIKKVRPTGEKQKNRLQTSALILYDVAGEQAKKSYDQNINDLIECADRVSILIDAQELSALGGKPSAESNSLRVASRWLSELDNKPRCLVVTKLDKVRDRSVILKDNATRQAWDEWRAELRDDSVHRYQPNGMIEGDLLKRLLSNSKVDFERQIYLEIVGTRACPVYFVWTEGIDAKSETSPVPVGLHRFIREWCLSDVAIVSN